MYINVFHINKTIPIMSLGSYSYEYSWLDYENNMEPNIFLITLMIISKLYFGRFVIIN